MLDIFKEEFILDEPKQFQCLQILFNSLLNKTKTGFKSKVHFF